MFAVSVPVELMASVTRFLTQKAKAEGQRGEKRGGATGGAEKPPNFTIANDGAERRIAPKALSKFKMKIRDMTQPDLWVPATDRGDAPYLIGWGGDNFGFCQTPRVLTNLEGWIRRRLRSYLWWQWRNGPNRFKGLTRPLRAALRRSVRNHDPGLAHVITPGGAKSLRNHVFDDLYWIAAEG